MKRFLVTFFITLALVVSAAGAAHAAHADDIECTLDNGGTACAVDGVSGICSGDENSGPYCRVTGTSDSTSFSDPAAANTPTNDKLGPPTTPKNTLNGIMAYIAQLFAWLLGVAVITLDYAVFYTVVTMGSYVNNLSAVGVTWQIMRDIGNIVIIFGFLVAGIATIISYDMYGWGKSMLPKLLIAAVFLNFSLFLSEAVIDTGNLFATQFYTQINGGQPAGEKVPAGVLTGINNEGISNKIMSSLGLMTIYGDVKNNNGGAEKLLDNYWTIGFMSIILFIVAAFVIFSLAFILIARFVILLFLIIVAPIGFAGLAVPKLESTAKKWWSALFEQTITAPVLLLLLYIALRVITDTQFLTGLGAISWTGTLSNNLDSFARTLISFLIAIGLLLAVVIISKKMSAFGGDWATKTAGKLTFGATAAVGRRTLGRASNYTARAIRSSRLGATSTGRILAGVADRGAKASFDGRGVKAFGGLGALKMGELGKPQEGGYRKTLEDSTKARADHVKTLSQNQKEQRDAITYQRWALQNQMNTLQGAASTRLQEQHAAALARGDVQAAQTLQGQLNQARAAAMTAQQHAQFNQLDTQRNNLAQPLAQVAQTIQNDQVRYANNLNLWWSRNVPTTGSAARNEAARQIRNDLATPAQQRLMQQLQQALNQQSPTPPPPGGQPPPAQPPPGQPPQGQASSIRFKEGVQRLASGLATVMSLTPVSYRYKDIPSLHITSENERLGFIAEEALGIEPRLVEVGLDGEAQTFNYQEYTAVLTRAVQEQQAQIDLLQKEIAALKKEPLDL